MNSERLSRLLVLAAAISLVIILLAGASFAQGLVADARIPDAPSATPTTASPTPMPIVPIQPAPVESRHKFFDRHNALLFAANAGLNTADFFVTRANLQSGGQEMNPVVRIFGRSTPGLAMNFAGETAGVIGLSYFFHRTGHHKLERVISYVNMSASAGAVSYGLSHR